MAAPITRLSLYGLVGVAAAIVHAGVLLGLGLLMPLWAANPLAFLAASIAGYLGHARYTFRPETGGQSFARRWLVLQYVVNLSVCGVLPLLLPNLVPSGIRLGILVFTPTVLNALIWSKAARFSAKQRIQRQRPRMHADDLGLSEATNNAILQLARTGKLDGASLLVRGPAAPEGVVAWKALQAEDPELELCLHLCLTEGPCAALASAVADLVNEDGNLNLSFGTWLSLSLLPAMHPRRKQITLQLHQEIKAQIAGFRQLCGGDAPIHLDGHQHIHLVPIVHDCLLSVSGDQKITWMRSTTEPLPTGLALRWWWNAIRQAGLLKWMVLELLSRRAQRKQQRLGISSNGGFAGVLFTGQMAGPPLHAAHQTLSALPVRSNRTQPLLLAHPGAPLSRNLIDSGFSVSQPFASSHWRQREWQALQEL
ncbi:MAG: hypothetical protein CMK50_07090 [Propionibacteriaceae bacterium]|nr:hypothetical protein [Propionibacteriaceae bacterium]